MRLWAFGCALAAALSVATTASAGAKELFAVFNDICVSTDAETSHVFAKADDTGWTKPSDAKMVVAGLRVSREKKDALGHLYLNGGLEEVPKTGEATRVCQVFEAGDGSADIATQLDAWVGFPPISADSKIRLYSFVLKNGVKTPLTPADHMQARDAAREGTLRLIVLDLTNQKTALNFSVVQPLER